MLAECWQIDVLLSFSASYRAHPFERRRRYSCRAGGVLCPHSPCKCGGQLLHGISCGRSLGVAAVPRDVRLGLVSSTHDVAQGLVQVRSSSIIAALAIAAARLAAGIGPRPFVVVPGISPPSVAQCLVQVRSSSIIAALAIAAARLAAGIGPRPFVVVPGISPPSVAQCLVQRGDVSPQLVGVHCGKVALIKHYRGPCNCRCDPCNRRCAPCRKNWSKTVCCGAGDRAAVRGPAASARANSAARRVPRSAIF